MTSLFSKAKNKVASWIGGGSSSTTSSSPETNSSSSASSPPRAKHQKPNTTSDEIENSASSSPSNQQNSTSIGNTASSTLASPSKLAQLDKILCSTTTTTTTTTSNSSTTSSSSSSSPQTSSSSSSLRPSLVDLNALRDICWCGIPDASKRYEAWCLMLRYMPNQLSMVPAVLQRKRNEYSMYVQNHHRNVPWDEMLSSQAIHGMGHNTVMMMNSASSSTIAGASSSSSNYTSNNENSNNTSTQASGEFSSSMQQATNNNNINLSSSSQTATANMDTSQEDLSIMRQIRKDVPRTFNGVHMLQHSRCQLLLERVLFIWAIRHPASGYVQGMNDILLPFLFVVLSKKISSDGDVYRLLSLPESSVKAVSGSLNEADWIEVEADSYWLLSAFMSSVQSNFTFSQGGTHSLVQKLDKIVALADPPLHMFLKESGVSFEEFAFRWMNCFLLREMSPALGVRLFDTYCAEEVNSTTNLGFTNINGPSSSSSITSTTITSSSSSSIGSSGDYSLGNHSNNNNNSNNMNSGGGGVFRLSGFAAFHVYVCAALLLRCSEKIRTADDFTFIVRLLQNPTDESFTEETIGELTAQAYVLHQQYGSKIA